GQPRTRDDHGGDHAQRRHRGHGRPRALDAGRADRRRPPQSIQAARARPGVVIPMRALDRKLTRDLLSMKGQIVAIALVMACGIATFVMSLSALSSLENTLSGYYERHRFAAVF